MLRKGSCCRGADPTLMSPSPALSLIVAMTVYTIERWNQPGNPQVQSFFAWSFYLGWVSTLLFLCTGDCDCCLGSSGAGLRGWLGLGWGLAGGGAGWEGGGWLGALREQKRSKYLTFLCYPRWPESGRSLHDPPAWLRGHVNRRMALELCSLKASSGILKATAGSPSSQPALTPSLHKLLPL